MISDLTASYKIILIGQIKKPKITLEPLTDHLLPLLSSDGCGGKTRTYNLWVMSPTSYQLLHPTILLSFQHVTLLLHQELTSSRIEREDKHGYQTSMTEQNLTALVTTGRIELPTLGFSV